MKHATIAVVTIVMMGCAGAQVDPLPTYGLAPAQAALAAMDGCIDVIEPLVPDTVEARTAFDVLHAVRTVGVGLATSWEVLGEEPITWGDWVVEALEALETMAGELKSAGADIPAEVPLAIGAAQLVWPILWGVIGAST